MPILAVIILLSVVFFYFWTKKPNPAQYTTKDLIAMASFFAAGIFLIFAKLVPAIFFIGLGAVFMKVEK